MQQLLEECAGPPNLQRFILRHHALVHSKVEQPPALPPLFTVHLHGEVPFLIPHAVIVQHGLQRKVSDCNDLQLVDHDGLRPV